MQGIVPGESGYGGSFKGYVAAAAQDVPSGIRTSNAPFARVS